jgi:hypothetical protein
LDLNSKVFFLGMTFFQDGIHIITSESDHSANAHARDPTASGEAVNGGRAAAKKGCDFRRRHEAVFFVESHSDCRDQRRGKMLHGETLSMRRI